MKVTLVLCALLGLSAASVIPEDWSSRIVGGSNAVIGQFPYQASIRSANNEHFCNGWIHNARWIGTAAQCTFGRTIFNTKTFVGTVSRTVGGLELFTNRIANHPNYNANSLVNDLALIQIVETLVFDDHIKPIVWNTVDTDSGIATIASGWGQTSNPGGLSVILQWKNTITISRTACRNRHSLGNRSRLTDAVVCTQAANNQGMCTGNAGSPLVHQGAAIGAYSWNIPCAQGLPDVFTRLSAHTAWLNSVIL